MKIVLQTILGIKQAIGHKSLEIDLPQGSTVADFVSFMTQTWGEKLSSQLIDPESGAVFSHVRIMVNGQTIQFLQGMNTLLNDGDEVLILPAASGG
jgi:sulfur-carrier protein